jgi:hypothetical protein
MALCSAPSMPRCWRTDRENICDAASGIDRASAQRTTLGTYVMAGPVNG